MQPPEVVYSECPLKYAEERIGLPCELQRENPREFREACVAWTAANSSRFEEHFCFPRILCWGRHEIRSFLRVHKKNLDRLRLVQFFLANGMNPAHVKTLVLGWTAHCEARRTSYDASARRQVDELIRTNNQRSYLYYDIVAQRMLRKHAQGQWMRDYVEDYDYYGRYEDVFL